MSDHDDVLKPKKEETDLWSVNIDGVKYEFEQWGASTATDILLDITSMVGEPLSAAAAGMYAGKGMTTEITSDLAATVVRGLMRNLKADKDKVKEILVKLSSWHVLADGKKVDYDKHYTGKIGLLFKVCRAGFEVQYGNFSDAILTPLGFSANSPSKTQGSALKS